MSPGPGGWATPAGRCSCFRSRSRGAQGPEIRLPTRRTFEAVATVALVALLSWIAARGVGPAYIIFPVLALVAIRFGARGATSAVFVSVAFVVWGETDRHGPFQHPRPLDERLGDAVVHRRRRHVEPRLDRAGRGAGKRGTGDARTPAARAFTATETERRRMERDLHDGAQQRLLALALRLGLQVRDAPNPTLEQFLVESEEHVNQAIDELRDLSRNPPIRSLGVGLANAIRTLAGRSTIPVKLVELPTTRIEGKRPGRGLLPADRGDRQCAEALPRLVDPRERRLPPGGSHRRRRGRRHRRCDRVRRRRVARDPRAAGAARRDVHLWRAPPEGHSDHGGDPDEDAVSAPVSVLLGDDSPVFLAAAATIVAATPGFELAAACMLGGPGGRDRGGSPAGSRAARRVHARCRPCRTAQAVPAASPLDLRWSSSAPTLARRAGCRSWTSGASRRAPRRPLAAAADRRGRCGSGGREDHLLCCRPVAG